jgi:hypothetical protein
LTFFDYLSAHPVWAFIFLVTSGLFADAMVVNALNTYRVRVIAKAAEKLAEGEKK